jgi:hypothetical protein
VGRSGPLEDIKLAFDSTRMTTMIPKIMLPQFDGRRFDALKILAACWWRILFYVFLWMWRNSGSLWNYF